MAPGGHDTLPLAEEGNEYETCETGEEGTFEGQMAAMTLADGELERDLEDNYTQGSIGAMNDLGFQCLG